MKKTNILFVCLGNICRSPMAETVMQSIVDEHNDAQNFHIDSAGIIDYHEGEQADGRMRSAAFRRGYRITSISRPVTADDFRRFDYIIGMDNANIQALNRKAPAGATAEIRLMTDFCTAGRHATVPDPYYGDEADFEHVIDILEDACSGFYEYLKKGGKIG